MKSSSSSSTILQCGAPHFRSIAKQHRHANYNLEKAINELIDNIIKLTNRIYISTEVDSEGRLQEIKVSDNFAHGFINILEQGINNPFNMGHIKSGHDDDNETSEFGCGGKAASISASNHLFVVTKVDGHFYEVICDFIKMEREENVIASYNPKMREISESDYNEVHPFENGSSIVLSKILGTICEQTTSQKLTQRIKKGISETYSRFLKENMDIRVNGEPVEREIDFFWDPNCMPFTIKKLLFILEKAGTNDKIYLIQKTVQQTSWLLYNKNDDKWNALKSVKEADDFREAKRREGYTYSCQQLNGLDGSCVRIETTFVFYSELVHTDEVFEHLLPQDQVLIYKDNRKYGKKSFVKHNDGNHNYTLHKVEFSSKKIGKELGITFNKEITMEGNNDLIMAIKSAIKDNRKEFNANSSTELNKKLCDKAIKFGIIDFLTCKMAKLSKTHREKRELLETKKTPSAKVVSKVFKPIPLKPVSTKVVAKSDDNDTSSDYSSSDESSTSASISLQIEDIFETALTEVLAPALNMDCKVENNVLNLDCKVENNVLNLDCKVENNVLNLDCKVECALPTIADTSLAISKTLLVKVSKLIANKVASDDFNITLENSQLILDLVQKMFNL